MSFIILLSAIQVIDRDIEAQKAKKLRVNISRQSQPAMNRRVGSNQVLINDLYLEGEEHKQSNSYRSPKSKHKKSVTFDIDFKPVASVIALTSFTNEKTVQECLDVGMLEVFNKPLTYKSLHRAMWKYFFYISQEEYKDLYKNAFNKSYS